MNSSDPHLDNKEPAEEPEKLYLSEEELPKPGAEVKPQTAAEKAAADAQAAKLASDNANYNKDIEALSKQNDDQETVDDTPKKHWWQFGGIFGELVVWGVITIAIVLVIQNFIFQAFYVSGSSMEPDYHNNDYLIISKIPITWFDVAKLFGAKNMGINRGDVLVFRYPNAPETFFIKRAIALPGERVTIHNGVITIYNKEHPEGFVLKEDYVDPQYVAQGDIDEIIEEGKVFVIGDNRSPGGSFDSRSWGQLDQKFITGFANIRLLPINSLKLLFRPEYPVQNSGESTNNATPAPVSQ